MAWAASLAAVAQDPQGNAPPAVIAFAREDPVTSTFVQAAQLGGSGGATPEQTNWLKVEFHYSVNPPDPTHYPFVDSVEFKVWIEGRDLYAQNAPGSQGVAICLTGSVTYVNLSQTQDGYGVFYVHPATLARYCGAGSYQDFDRKFDVHVEANVGGKIVAAVDKRRGEPDKWWTQPTAVPNFVFRQDQSPFINADVMHYPQIKLPAVSQ